jgi:Leucine-rich repeat (LRR) protein
MSAAEDAYRAAEAAIEEAKRTGADTLDLSGEAFRALETLPPGIGELDALRTLELNHTQVGDLAPLRELTGLQTLRLDSTQVSELAPLQGLTRLQTLSLRRTQVSELAPLRGLTELQALVLDSTQVSDLAPLQGLTGLQTLALNSLRVSNVAPLAGLTALSFLSLNYTLVSDVAPLAGVMSIDAVQSFDDIHSLEGLQKFTALQLSHTSIRDISPIGYLKRLSSLLLDGTPVSDLEPLRELTRLQRLRLDSTQVNDIEPLRGLTNLHTLSLSKTRVNELAPLRELTRIDYLSLSGTLVNDLQPLQNLQKLRELFLDNTRVSDLAPLQGLAELQTLALNTTQVSDLAPLQGLTGLQTLALNTTRASDLRPLRGLTKLQTLSLITTQVSDLDPLRGLTGLRNLSLDNTQVLDLRPLQRLGRLADEPKGGGLSFRGIPATSDPTIAEIAEIEEDAARAKAMLALLDAGWVPPVASSLRNGKVDGPPPEPGSTPAFFFLSYASRDRPQIGTFRDFLMGQGVPVWWDQDIPAGAEWRRMIAGQLDAAKAVVTFWTRQSVMRKAVIEEASHAQAAGRLLHVRLDDAPLPYGFGETQYVDLRGWDGTANHPQMAKLLQALRDRLNPPDSMAMAARLLAASPVAMLPKDGRLAPVDTPPNVRPEVENAPDLAARVEGMKQILGPLRAMAADRDHYQFPADLGHALASVYSALHAETLSWYGIELAHDMLCDCMSAHDAGQSWNMTMVRQLDRLTQRLAELRPLLQPRQVPAGEAGAKPPEPDPVVRAADVPAVQDLAQDVSAVLESPEALATLDPASIDLLRAEVDRIQHAADTGDEGRRYFGLRKAVRGLAYATGAIIGAVTSAVTFSLLTVPQAAAALAARLKPVFDRLLRYFM